MKSLIHKPLSLITKTQNQGPRCFHVRASSRSAAVHASTRSAAGMRASSGSTATGGVGVLGCPPRRSLSCCIPGQQLEVCVGAVVSVDGAGGFAAQSLGLRCSGACCSRRRCLHLRFGCCQPRRPFRRYCGLCRCSLALLYCSQLGLLSAPHARGDRVLRVSCGHGALRGDYCCCGGRFLHQTSYCLSAQREEGEQEQQVLLLLARAAARLRREGSKRCLGCRITWL